MITIDLLKNHTQHIPRLIEIWHEGIAKTWLPDVCLGRVQEKLQEHVKNDRLPLTLVALHDGVPVGMCSLRENDGIKPGLIYKKLSIEDLKKIAWLGSLVVDPKYQKQGIGKMLIEATKEKACTLSLKKLYLFAFDPTIPIYYKSLGWKHLGIEKFNNHPVTIMEITL